MKLLIERGGKACHEGERETAEAKKQRKKAIEARIAANAKRQERASTAKASSLTTRAIIGTTVAATQNDHDTDSESLDHESIDNDAEHQDSDEEDQQGDSGKRPNTEDALQEDSDQDAMQEDSDDSEVPDVDIKSEAMRSGSERDEGPMMARYERQVALIRGEPLFDDDHHCRVTLATLHPLKRIFNPDIEFEDILEHCVTKLDPEPLQEDLVEYLRNRLATASPSPPPLPTADSSTEEILEALHVLHGISTDVVIRCASAQLMLYSSIRRQCSDDSSTAEHLDIIRALAAKKAGNVTEKEKDKVCKSYEREYYSGKRWLHVIDMFGGDGVVILFLVAGKFAKHPL